jgi:hypothetical protein
MELAYPFHVSDISVLDVINGMNSYDTEKAKLEAGIRSNDAFS